MNATALSFRCASLMSASASSTIVSAQAPHPHKSSMPSSKTHASINPARNDPQNTVNTWQTAGRISSSNATTTLRIEI
ncbi:hypothetical protein BDR22DRAFT_843479 [Usnea florida]